MTHDFLLKARTNPDLQDFCDYLKKPLQILDELEYRYKILPLDTKVKPANMMTHFKIDKMLNQYLPNMVDNYCDFSFKYRNEHFIKTVNTKDGNVSYTAKEMLLQNLAKLIEEIYILEEEFNENNKFKLLVQEKILTNLGYASELEEAPSKIVLENKFKYKDQEIFKKPVKELPKDIKNSPPITKSQVVESSNLFSLNFIEILLVLSFVALGGVMFFTTSSEIDLKNKITREVVNLNILVEGTKTIYATKENYAGLSNKVISNARVVPDAMMYNNGVNNNFGGRVNIKASVNPSEFEILYEGVPENACNRLVQNVSPKFSKIMIGAYTIKDVKENIVFDPIKLYDVCKLSSTKKEAIIFTSN